MIPNTLFALLSIRVSIFALRAITPLSIVYWISRLALPSPLTLPLPFAVITAAEAVFYFAVYLPRRHALNNSGLEPTNRTREERRALFRRCLDSIHDLEQFLYLWFRGHDPLDVGRENVKDLMAWCFLDRAEATTEDDEELEEYTDEAERRLGRKLLPGRSKCRPMRVTMDPLDVRHRSLLYYVFVIGTVDTVCIAQMFSMGFEHHRLLLSQALSVFPFRPLCLLIEHVSPAKNLSYWHRLHTSKSRMPVLFLHGIGIGLHTYTSFLNDVIQTLDDDDDDGGQIGILAIELMPVSFRICHAALPKDEMVEQIHSILSFHNYSTFVLASHSYGSVVATHILRDSRIAPRIGSMLLVDPVTLSMHYGDIPFKFLYRMPRTASERQLHYFACSDLGVAHTVARRFDWTHNVLWKDELMARRATVLLAGRDIIVDTERLGRYLSVSLAGEGQTLTETEEWKHRAWKGEGLDILWLQEANHAEVFDTAHQRAPLVTVLEKYTRLSTGESD